MGALTSLEKIRSYLIVVAIASMIAGLFFSRALLTTGSILLFLGAVMNTNFSILCKKNGAHYQLLLIFLFLIPVISGLWSSDLSEWWQRCETKLPFLLFPVAFAMIILTRKTYICLSVLFIALVVAGTVWSFILYLQNIQSIHAGYLRSTLMKVWLNNDHVLFSWAIVLAILLTIQLLSIIKHRSINHKIISWIVVTWLIVFLHILAARTGLVCLYVVALTIAIYKLSKSSIKTGIIIIFAMAVIPTLAFFLLPTFHNRVLYVLYDLQQYGKGNYPAGFSDVSRILSLKGGLDITKQHLIAGVGFGDIFLTMNHWYDANYSYIPQNNRILPHNEWLIYSCGSGIFALIIFTYIVVYPLLRYKQWCWMAFNFTALICFFSDATLETQNGVFLYCFFICWMKPGIRLN